MNAIHNNLKIKLCTSPEDAIAQGYVYREPEFNPIQIEEAVVIQGGMQNGKSTVDFIMKDATGKKYVLMITGSLLKSIPC